MFSYEFPGNSDKQLASAQETTTAELADLLERLYSDRDDGVEAVVRGMKPSSCYEIQHYEEFIIRELLNRSLMELSNTGEFDNILST